MLTVMGTVIMLMIAGTSAGLQNAARLATNVLMSDNQARRVEELISNMTQPLDYLDLAELVGKATEGDERALETLYHRFKTPIFNLARRYTGSRTAAEDVLQDVFVAAFTHMGDVKEVAKFPGWLFRVAVNTSLAHVRSAKVRGGPHVPIQDVEAFLAAPADACAAADARRPIEQAMDVLPPKLKTVFLLHDVEGFKHEEIANMLGCTVGTSKSNLFKARMKLRQRLTEQIPATRTPPEPPAAIEETQS
jgi:RNA polymerase sigma-70 factor (ECF subfamily)